jgi:two-component system LytT family sensor kinase
MDRSRIRYLIEVIIHVLFWAGVYYVLKALTSTSYNMVIKTADKGMQSISASLLFRHSSIVLGFLMLLFYSNSLWLFKKVIRFKTGFTRVAVIGGWSILLFTMNYLVIKLFIRPGGEVRIPVLPRVEPPFVLPPPADNWLHMQLVIALVFLAVLAVAIAEFFIKEWIRNDLTRSQAEAQQLSLEIKFLRSQVNPHFLFNTLNNLFSMAQKKGNDDLADGISKLSGLMRYMIYESDTGKVFLQKEIDYLRNYIALNKLRYADSEVAVTFVQPFAAAIAEVRIAPMLFIPFVENAFKHGVSIGRRSCIAIAIAVDAGRLVFTCENADHSAVRKLAEDRSGIGLANVKRHLELVYPGGYELRTLCDDGKYSVYLQIDLA